MEYIEDTLKDIFRRKGYLSPYNYSRLLDEAITVSEQQDCRIRPTDRRGLPGGIVFPGVNGGAEKPVIVIPDIHARMDFILSVMNYKFAPGLRILDALMYDQCIVVCVGDGFHGEARVRDRWYKAYDEYLSDYSKHSAMDEEMRESLGLLEMLLHLRIRFPDNFFFLKGNHENIANEGIEGNYPFGKFVREGEMVTYWIQKFMGDDVFKGIYLYEKTLPILAVCNDFIVTHAEPARFYDRDQIINCYLDPDIIYAFTWTDNNAAEENSVSEILEHFFPGKTHTVMFGGHRPIRNKYNLRANGRYIQLHNPDDFIVAIVYDMNTFNIDDDIYIIPRNI